MGFSRARWGPGLLSPGGELRGGASAAAHNGEFYNFAHSFNYDSDRPDRQMFRYAMVLYTFGAVPPFETRRYVPFPLMDAPREPATRSDVKYGADVHVVYPVRRRPSGWIVARRVWVSRPTSARGDVRRGGHRGGIRPV